MKRKWIFVSVFVLSISCFGTPRVHAASQSTQLEPVIVTATKTEKELENVPAVVTVISQEEIQQTPARTVGDLLANLPGVYVNEPQGVGLVTPQSMTISGLGSAGHTLILMDGQKVNTPFTDYAYLTTLPVRAVDRIEVLRGPYSALYGSSAGGGIINIITKDGGGETYLQPWGDAGNFGRYDYGLDAGLTFGNFSLGVFYDHKEVDNYMLYEDQGVDTENREYDHDRFHAKLTGTLGDKTNIAISGGTVDGETQYGVGDNLGVDCHQDIKHPYVNAQLESFLSDRWTLKAQADWLRSEHNYYGETLETINWINMGFYSIPDFVYKASLNETVADRYHGDLNTSWTFAGQQILTLGAEISYFSVEKKIMDADTGAILDVQGRQGDVTDEDETQYSFYAQWDGTFFDTLELILGGRFDDYDSYGNEFSPKAAIRWNYIPGGNIRLSVGKGFKAPSLSQLYSVPWSISSFIVYQGNPDLDAEIVWAYQASIEQRLFDDAFFVRVTPYFSKADDFITSVRYDDPLNDGGQIMQPENVDEVEIKGVDVELSYEILKGLTPFFNYNYNETRDNNTNAILDGYPRNSAAIGLRFNLPFAEVWRTYGSYAARYRGSWTSSSWGRTTVTEEVGDYWYHTASIALLFNEMIEVKGEFFNIFNDRSTTDIDDYLPEFNYLIGVSFKYTF